MGHFKDVVEVMTVNDFITTVDCVVIKQLLANIHGDMLVRDAWTSLNVDTQLAMARAWRLHRERQTTQSA